jgi:hypothetical protein
MPEKDFAVSILETEVVVNHIADGHVFGSRSYPTAQ